MKTRIGKIAQLPKLIRDDLNHRLQNGQQGPDLLKWLNALPETQTLLDQKFDSVPVSKQNLSEWRQGGYEEWLRHQEHDQRVQRIVEEGECLGKHDANSDDDLFEHSARIALAELMTEFDSLHELKGEERFRRLRGLTRELARLQYANDHSRRTVLAFSKWKERFLGPEDYENEEEDEPESNASAPQLETPNPKPETSIETPAVTLGQSTSSDGEPLGAPASRPAQPLPSPRPDSVALPVPAEPDDRVYLRRPVHYHQTCGHVCRHCHPENGDYPYTEALKDSTEAKQRGVQAFWRGHTMINTAPIECACPCPECEPKLQNSDPRVSPLSPVVTQSPHELAVRSDFLRQMALLRNARR